MENDCSRGTGPLKQNVAHLSNRAAASCMAA